MKFLYFANARLPGEKAHAIQIMKTCAALAATEDVILVHARRRNREWLRTVTDLRAFYALPYDVPRRSVPSLDLFDLVPRLPFGHRLAFRGVFLLQLLTYHLTLIPILITGRADAYYTRDSLTAALLSLLRPGQRRRVFYEAHTFPTSVSGRWLQRTFVSRIGGVLTLTNALAERYRDLPRPPGLVTVIPDGVDPTIYGNTSRSAARTDLKITPDRIVVMYVGQMYVWKGVDILVKAAQHLPSEFEIWLVGGTPEELPRIEALAADLGLRNVRFLGYVKHAEIPRFLAASDILVLPNSGQSDISRFYTSPLKLFEYMAAGRPIVASDLPALKEVLTDGKTALLVPPDDALTLAQAIRRLACSPELAQQLGTNAQREVQAFSWDRRAARILQFVKSQTAPRQHRIAAP